MENVILKMHRITWMYVTENNDYYKLQKPEKLLQWADDFYTDLVSLQTFYGSIPDQ